MILVYVLIATVIMMLLFCAYVKPKKVTINFIDIPVFARINTPRADWEGEDLKIHVPFVGEYVQPPYSEMKGHFIQVGDWPVECGFDGQNMTFVIPSKQPTDFASIPRPLHSLITPVSNSIYAAVLHDYLYRDPVEENAKRVTKQQADRIFYWGMRAKGVPLLRSGIMYRAVWLFGGCSYRSGRYCYMCSVFRRCREYISKLRSVLSSKPD